MEKEAANGMDFERSEIEPKKKQSLYNITNNYNELMSAIEETEGVMTEDQITALEITEKELKVKSIAYLQFIKGKDAINSQIDEEIKRLNAMKKVNKNIISRLKDNLLMAVNLFGPFEVGLNKFGTRKSESLSVLDAALVPKKFKVRTITESVQKMEIKKAIKNGEKIEGVELVTNLNLKIN